MRTSGFPGCPETVDERCPPRSRFRCYVAAGPPSSAGRLPWLISGQTRWVLWSPFSKFLIGLNCCAGDTEDELNALTFLLTSFSPLVSRPRGSRPPHAGGSHFLCALSCPHTHMCGQFLTKNKRPPVHPAGPTPTFICAAMCLPAAPLPSPIDLFLSP